MTVNQWFAMKFRHGTGMMHMDPRLGPLSDKSEPPFSICWLQPCTSPCLLCFLNVSSGRKLFSRDRSNPGGFHIGSGYIMTKDMICLSVSHAWRHTQKTSTFRPPTSRLYISTGYNNWKDASGRFAAHEASTCHKDAIPKTIALPATMHNIGKSLSAQLTQNELERCQYFLKLLSNVMFLARKALPLCCGGDESGSDYSQLLKLHGEDDQRILDWIKRKTDKYTQNEMMKTMAFQILRKIAVSPQTTQFYTIMADEKWTYM